MPPTVTTPTVPTSPRIALPQEDDDAVVNLEGASITPGVRVSGGLPANGALTGAARCNRDIGRVPSVQLMHNFVWAYSMQ